MEPRPRILFLVPAHNEELLVGAGVQSLMGMDYPSGRCRTIVIADNCTDGTVARATAAGAEVWERIDQSKLGKSEAIGWAINRIELDQWDAVVIIDADSIVDSGFASALAEHAPLRGKIIQTYNGMSNEFETWLTRLSGVLTRIRYDVEFPKRQANNLNVPLAGNGLCIGAGRLSIDGWKAETITEGWEFYARWTAAGVRIYYCPEARLWSQEPASMRQGGSQRLRWSSGRAEVFRRWRGPILRSQAIGLHQKLDAIWALGSPSPIVGALLALSLCAVSLLFVPRPLSLFLAALAVATMLPWVESIARVFWTHPQKLKTLRSFAMLPPYALWRGVLQVRAALTGTSGGWVRTARH